MTEQFVAGIVGTPFGLKGFVKVKPLSGEIEHLLKLTAATLRRDGAVGRYRGKRGYPARCGDNGTGNGGAGVYASAPYYGGIVLLLILPVLLT